MSTDEEVRVSMPRHRFFVFFAVTALLFYAWGAFRAALEMTPRDRVFGDAYTCFQFHQKQSGYGQRAETDRVDGIPCPSPTSVAVYRPGRRVAAVLNDEGK
jgi:hypothetical protein